MKPYWDDYAAVHGYGHIPYRYKWSTGREKQHWIQFEASRFLSWAPRGIADYPDFKNVYPEMLAHQIPQTLIDHLSSSQKQELRRQILRLAQVGPISRWCDEHIHVSQIAADIQTTMEQVVIQMRSMTDNL